jgi:hypothetical protein
LRQIKITETHCSRSVVSRGPDFKPGYIEEVSMKLNILTLATAALILIAPTGFAQGVSNDAPGQQPNGANGSPGASYNAPGQEMRRDAPNPNPGSPGASGYAPGRSTTGSGALKRDRDDTTRTSSK